ncbi:MAG TPA: hypothetical protein VKT78_06155 [Fimbriimonadaceae bacterium]|nr:hypothetical protein [Fimbriimonadaceae bacterium]
MKLKLATVLLAIAVPLVFAQHNSMADQDTATTAAKQLALGTLMYTQDADDKFPSTAWQSGGTYPYVKNLSVYMPFPGDKPAETFTYRYKGSRPVTVKTAFVMNPALYGKLTTSLKAAGQTVMWSYGPRKHLGYVFNGKTLIAFTDGHVKLITKAEAQKLRWKP